VARRRRRRVVIRSVKLALVLTPDWLEPMAATLTQERFTGPDWVFERKLDGIRLLAFKSGPAVRLLSRNRLPQDESYPSVVQAISELPVSDAVLDGEGLGVWRAGEDAGYHLFDVLWFEGRDVRSLPLDARRALLERLPLAPPLHRVERLDDREPWERARREGWEGVIAKRRDSAYEPRRSRNWLKMKVEASQELVVGGFTDPKGRRVGLGALLVGYYQGDDFVFAGKLGTGFDTKLLLELRARLSALEIAQPPFTKGTGLPRAGAHWVRPEVVVQAAFLEWTTHGKLRHPRLLGVRMDKAARSVTRETP
jgi:bifunctional non-homologous end joining protein LigD